MNKSIENLSYVHRTLIHGVVYENSTLLKQSINFHGTLTGSPSLTNSDFDLYLDSFYEHPFRTIRRLNEVVDSVPLTPRVRINLLSDVLNLEILTDNIIFPDTGDEVFNGIPHYLPDGYTDLGSFSDGSSAERKGRAKFRFRKKDLYPQLLFAKKNTSHETNSLYSIEGVQKIISSINHYLGLMYDFDNFNVSEREFSQDGSVAINFYCGEDGKHSFVCRHIAVTAQMMLQSAGIISRLRKGNIAFGGRHAWNSYRVGDEKYLVDFTNGTGVNNPIPLSDEVYQICYIETDDQRNHYKIKRKENQAFSVEKPLQSILKRKLRTTNARSRRQLKKKNKRGG
ncbi:hypothetical protein HQ489_03485 [Candidatus Woesearchaeota archaeon]|nr:hypothetical protein [Candidatus Woesearchaeota archaeon]